MEERSLVDLHDEFETEMRRVCPDAPAAQILDATAAPPPWISPPRLVALLRSLPDGAGHEAFMAAWYATAPEGEWGEGPGRPGARGA
jgi:hypothetical protein